MAKEMIDEFRKRIPVSREEAYWFVDEDFAQAADDVWKALGSPEIDLGSVWNVFDQMAPLLSQ